MTKQVREIHAVHVDCPLTTVNWDGVPDGYVELTFRVPDKDLGFSAGMTADLIIRKKKQPSPTPLDELPFLSPPPVEEENAIREKYGLPLKPDRTWGEQQ